MNKKTRNNVVMLIVGVLILSISQIPVGYAAEPFNTESVLIFLRDVVKLDMAKYNATLVLGPFVDVRDDLGGLVSIYGKYTLKSATGNVNVVFDFINNTLCSCQLYFTEGLPQYSQAPESNIRDAVKGILQRHQDSTGDSSLNLMSQMLDEVDIARNATEKNANMTLEISVTVYSTSFQWRDTFNGADYSSFSVGFQNGFFYLFSQDRSYMRVGSTEVNISKETAISMALERVSGYSYMYGSESISNLTVATNNIWADLLTKRKDEPLKLYPYWKVTLPLNGYYPGFVTMIVVEIWAGSGQVIRVYPLGTGGGLPDVSPSASIQPTLLPETSASNTSPSPTQSASIATPLQSGSPSTQPSPAFSQPTSAASPTAIQPFPPQTAENTGGSADLSLTYVAVATVVVVAVAVGAVAFLKWRRK